MFSNCPLRGLLRSSRRRIVKIDQIGHHPGQKGRHILTVFTASSHLHLTPSTTLLRRATTSFGREVRDAAVPKAFVLTFATISFGRTSWYARHSLQNRHQSVRQPYLAKWLPCPLRPSDASQEAQVGYCRFTHTKSQDRLSLFCRRQNSRARQSLFSVVVSGFLDPTAKPLGRSCVSALPSTNPGRK